MTKLISYDRKKLIPYNKRELISYNMEKEDSKDFKSIVDDIFEGNWLRRNLIGDAFKIDVEETDNEFIIYAELPGIQKNEVQVSMNNETLIIAVNKKEDIEEEKKNYIHKERYFTSTSRNVYLAGVKSDEIKAKLTDGMLTVTVQKQEKRDNTVKIDIE